jgi:hypothetical protein
MQVRKQRGHLLVSKSSSKGRHQAFSGENHCSHFSIGCGSAAGELGFPKDGVQIGWDLFQVQIVLFVAVRTASQVEMLAFRLLLGETRRRAAADKECGRHAWQQELKRSRDASTAAYVCVGPSTHSSPLS